MGQRRPRRILRVLPDHTDHDRPLHRRPVLRLRAPQKDHEPLKPVFAPHTRHRGWAGRRSRSGLTTPLDVVKTLLQTRGTSEEAEIRHARGMLDACKVIWARDGPKGFMRGLTPRVLTFMPSNALCWLSYEFFSAFLSFLLVRDLTFVCRGGNTRRSPSHHVVRRSALTYSTLSKMLPHSVITTHIVVIVQPLSKLYYFSQMA